MIFDIQTLLNSFETDSGGFQLDRGESDCQSANDLRIITRRDSGRLSL
jgi:hypothetical protein